MRLTARTITIVRKCDGRLRRGWYRFMGAAGIKMPPQVVPISRCRTDATGWLSGSHPTVNQGAVRRRVCFHWAGRDRRRRKYDRPCMWSRYIRVLNCTTFLVYELIPIKDDSAFVTVVQVEAKIYIFDTNLTRFA